MTRRPAAFRRLCVETVQGMCRLPAGNQPPSGGCVLKQNGNSFQQIADKPAAFRRLCVETPPEKRYCSSFLRQPPSGGCVLKQGTAGAVMGADVPAAFRRLCVETAGRRHLARHRGGPAAFRRLCVETGRYLVKQARHDYQPPSGGCVLKPSFPTAVCFAALQPPSGGCVLKPVRF